MSTRRTFLRTSAVAIAGAASPPLALSASRTGKSVTVVVFLRGGADALNIVVPHGDPDYYRLRPSLAVPRPDRRRQDAAIDLDGFFGLHPALAPLMPVWDAGHLAIAHAVGSPGHPRRHFEAEAAVRTALGAAASAPRGLAEIARRIRSGEAHTTEVAEIGGWDHHVKQAAQMPPLLAGLARSIASFWRNLEDRMAEISLLVLSEFGRGAGENPASGTDHGWAGCVFAIGGAVRGGRVYAKWPGLAPEQLCDGRSLAVTAGLLDFIGQPSA